MIMGLRANFSRVYKNTNMVDVTLICLSSNAGRSEWHCYIKKSSCMPASKSLTTKDMTDMFTEAGPPYHLVITYNYIHD